MNLPAESQRPYRTVPFERMGKTTRLFRDFLSQATPIRPFFGPAFDDVQALPGLVERVRSRTYPRPSLTSALLELAREVNAPRQALEAIERFRRDDTLVVFAGQQTGLFTGPLYTVYKALTVERWARDLSVHLGTDVVPMFWLSTDDHDFAEVEWVGYPREGQFEVLRYRPAALPALTPIGRVKVDDGLETVISHYAAALPDSEFKPDVFAALRRSYAPGRAFATAMGRLWYELFPQSRLVFVAPGSAAMSHAAAPLLQRALQEEETLFQLYRTDSEKLLELGYHAQVHKSSDQTFLFHQQQSRQSIHRQGDRYVWEGAEPVARGQLVSAIAAQPEHFSPNVLLRPLVQNSLFPTLGVVLGPSELAYYAQLAGLHDHFQVPRPLVLPRTSATIVEASVARRLKRHEVDPTMLGGDLDGEVARVLRARFPRDLHERFEQAARRIESIFDEVRPEIAAFEPTLDAPVRAAGVRARREMEQLAQRTHAAHKHKEEELEAQIRRAALQLFPEGELQERRFNVVYYWARYGPEWLTRLRDHWPAGSREHLLWEG